MIAKELLALRNGTATGYTGSEKNDAPRTDFRDHCLRNLLGCLVILNALRLEDGDVPGSRATLAAMF